MRKSSRSVSWAMLAGVLTFAVGPQQIAAAEESAAPFQLSLIEQVQLFPEDESVCGARLGLLSARNQNVSGFDGVVLASLTDDNQVGVQLSLYSQAGGDLLGLQAGVLRANVDGAVTGVQISNLATHSGPLTGVQISSLYNRAHGVRGLQIALVNDAQDLKGVQLGLLNVNRTGWLPVVPFLNFGF